MEKNVADIVLKRMETLLANRDLEIKKLEDLRAAAEAEKKNCQKLVEDAKDKMDLCAFQEARKKTQDIQDRIELYSARIGKIKNARMVSEEESDSIIDSLTAYEDDMAAEYELEAGKIIEKLRVMTDGYLGRVNETEKAIKQWTTLIHPNFRSSTTTVNGSNRMDAPVPVHPIAYRGCGAAISASKFVDSYFQRHEEPPKE